MRAERLYSETVEAPLREGSGELRKIFLVIAIILMGIVVLMELASLIDQPDALSFTELQNALPDEPGDDKFDDVRDDIDADDAALSEDAPPGLAIPYMAMVDGLLLFTVILMGLPLVIPERVHGRVQGIASLIVSFLLILGAILLVILAFTLLILMISLLTAVPFGTIAYFAIFAFFERGTATAILSVIMLLKLAFAVCMILAHQRMLQNKGFVLMVATSLIANLIIAFLHGIVPLFLVSITDAIAAIIMAILAIIWAILMLIGAIVAVIRIIRIQPSVLQPSG